MRQEQEKARDEEQKIPNLTQGDLNWQQAGDLSMPAIPYWRCRQIMTRPDFLDGECSIVFERENKKRQDKSVAFIDKTRLFSLCCRLGRFEYHFD